MKQATNVIENKIVQFKFTIQSIALSKQGTFFSVQLANNLGFIELDRLQVQWNMIFHKKHL